MERSNVSSVKREKGLSVPMEILTEHIKTSGRWNTQRISKKEISVTNLLYSESINLPSPSLQTSACGAMGSVFWLVIMLL